MGKEHQWIVIFLLAFAEISVIFRGMFLGKDLLYKVFAVAVRDVKGETKGAIESQVREILEGVLSAGIESEFIAPGTTVSVHNEGERLRVEIIGPEEGNYDIN